MVIDTSAVAAILFDEPEADRFETLIVADRTRLILAASVPESSLVVEARLGDAGGQWLDLMLHRAQVEPGFPGWVECLVTISPDSANIGSGLERATGRDRGVRDG